VSRVAAAILCGLAVAATGATAVGAAGGASYTGWDGVNPFRCVLQNAGTGTAVPDPGADPYCVQFDKTHQNVTDLGIAQFLSLEPARVAAASPKCFYFQSDHWRGSIVQDNGATEVYEFYGHYFFDKARGAGGVWVTDFNVNGHTYDPNQIPGIPPQFSQDLGPGTGGVQATGDVPADPACAARAAADPGSIYASPAAPRPSETGPVRVPPTSACLTPSGAIGARGVGAVRLGDGAQRVRALLGAPVHLRGGLMHYCLRGGGKFIVAPSPHGAVMVLTTSAGYELGAIRRGTGATAFHRRFPAGRPILRQGATRVWTIQPGKGVIAGLRRGRVRFLAVYDRRSVRGRAALAAMLRRSQ
jgi:hypothetical protein